MKACVPSLLRKIIKYRPRFVCLPSSSSPILFSRATSHSMVAFVGMKICEIVLRYLHNLPLPSPPPPVAPSSSSATSLDPPLSPSKSKRKAAMPKVKIGLQPVVISLPAGVEKVDEVKKEEGESKPKQEEEEEEQRGEKQQEQRKIYIWCLPATSARVVEYQVRPFHFLLYRSLLTSTSLRRSSTTRSPSLRPSVSPSTASKPVLTSSCRKGRSIIPSGDSSHLLPDSSRSKRR